MSVKVRERPKGSGTWWVFIDHQGKRKAKKIGKDKKTAVDVAKKIEAKLILGELNIEKAESNCPAFREYAEMWLAMSHDWKESTAELYKANLVGHILPAFGKNRVDEISRKDLKAFFDNLLAGGMAFSTVKVIRASISGIFANAVDSELIEHNPLQGLKINHKRTPLEVDPLTEEEVDKFLEEAKNYQGGVFYPPFLCALRTGMRIGEIQAVQWGDVDFNSRFIEVKRSWRNGRLTDTKNRKRRRIDMTPHLAETLKALRIIQKKRALKNGMPVSEWVFADTKGKMLCREVFRRVLNKCLEYAGLRRIRVHDLRHCYATIRLLRGHNVGDVSYQLGHSSISITYDTYGHWMPGKFKSEVDELDKSQQTATYTQPVNKAAEIL